MIPVILSVAYVNLTEKEVEDIVEILDHYFPELLLEVGKESVIGYMLYEPSNLTNFFKKALFVQDSILEVMDPEIGFWNGGMYVYDISDAPMYDYDDMYSYVNRRR